ncbi:hypothetical protein GFS31_41040 (plasmid) [Leptolyngbya sp. BL0902]|uniref:hypothetical protein n=1 Tax=Leptolyngbya sp. BL0902 TaxID=1115757 RepID=UPI0018E80398|nr:hypothetical protein [Leptolyngbya sp. BL0902]QQE67391.1 hypothetical protein GFS31_41040 [Leptolyngbya sp. BL0902]
MASVLISFVGNQDPVSDGTREDGSIISLVRHLMANQQAVQRVILLYTTGASGTAERAELTQGWLTDAPFHFAPSAVDLISVGEELSHDPVNLWLAVQVAQRGLGVALAAADRLEINGSSGTPVMKSAWSILQAAGYAPKSRLWQVRNPKEQQPGQARVFESNIQVLRQAFDIRAIRQQLQDYNYVGGLTTLRTAGLATPTLEALLTYGHRRLSLDFGGAKDALKGLGTASMQPWRSSVEVLLQRDALALMQEAYFNGVVELKNRQFSDFLVRVSQFLEMALEHFVSQQLDQRPSLPKGFDETEAFWRHLSQNRPQLYQFLQDSKFKSYPLRLDGFPNRPTLLAILRYGQFPQLADLEFLGACCEQRNRYIHQFEGISDLSDANAILQALRRILEHLGLQELTNPFNQLNDAISQLLESTFPAANQPLLG